MGLQRVRYGFYACIYYITRIVSVLAIESSFDGFPCPLDIYLLPNFSFFSLRLLIMLVPLHLHMNFRIRLSITVSKKANWELDRDFIDSLDQLGEYCHFHNIKSSDP